MQAEIARQNILSTQAIRLVVHRVGQAALQSDRASRRVAHREDKAAHLAAGEVREAQEVRQPEV
jgi:hypothetical protein